MPFFNPDNIARAQDQANLFQEIRLQGISYSWKIIALVALFTQEPRASLLKEGERMIVEATIERVADLRGRVSLLHHE